MPQLLKSSQVLHTVPTHRFPAAAVGFADGFSPHGVGGVDGDAGEVAAVAAALKEKVESAARLPDIQGCNSIEIKDVGWGLRTSIGTNTGATFVLRRILQV